jgi:hypothetical protein
MKAAIITPYYKEDISVLRRCHISIQDQSVPCRHFMVADGFSNELVNDWNCEHIILASSHSDNGNTPRAIGAISAINQGHDLVCFLDADNWYTSNHVEEAIRLKNKNPAIDIAVLGRQIILPDGTLVEEDIEDRNRTHIDTSCYAFFRSSFGLLPAWGMMQPFLGPICDRIMFYAIQSRNLQLGWSDKKTCFFTSNYKAHYIQAGVVPPAKTNDYDLRDIAKNFTDDWEHFTERTGLQFQLTFKEAPIKQKAD